MVDTMDAKFIPGKGLKACRDLKKDEGFLTSAIDYCLWIHSEYYGTKNIEK